ncbi:MULTISPECIES: 2Fe-2S iron-sulfur cluster-binding protein [unclassified Streptomyces]|uniref:2Fe-2S iron-sulfur cluster-binding protein n=1 Tax=unclassified Streptomyces TaxID=2593676 RepID=UPI0019065AE1|nr:2Fe-2S iron-sulfur cluster-binding protein [Streptomyces sp. HSG2]
MARFHRLRVAAVDRLTEDSVALTLAVPPEHTRDFRHVPGQHLTLRRFVGGREERRTYSICSPAPDPRAAAPELLRVGIRLVEGGSFSTYAAKEIAVGDQLEAMPPAGRFTLRPAPGHYAAIVGGSGITPVLSIASTLLACEPAARFCLVRGDRTSASTMFLEEVADLKDRFRERFHLVTMLSREEQQAGLPSGRLDRARLAALLPVLLPVGGIDGWFLCGPQGLVRAAESALEDLAVRRDRVHQEIFHVDSPAPDSDPLPTLNHGTITARLDGRSGTWSVRQGESVLDTVLRNRADTPYACKGGVCGTCRALLVSGEVRMDRDYALEAEEMERGYVLACQSRPMTEAVEVDFDR